MEDHPSTTTIPINRKGYFVTSRLRLGEVRTYACTDKAALAALLFHLTGRTIDTFITDEVGTPRFPGLSIAYPCHIYGRQEAEL